jgi:hypothetical protein
MNYKFSAEVRTLSNFVGSYDLVLKVVNEGTEWSCQKVINPDDLLIKGVFDLVFDEMKDVLKWEMKKDKGEG